LFEKGTQYRFGISTWKKPTHFSETDIINMLKILIDNIICYVWWTCFSTDSLGTNCVPLPADFASEQLFSYIKKRTSNILMR
jgi:hypothetical protein